MVTSLCLINYEPCHEDVWGNVDIPPSFSTSAIDGSGQLHAPAALLPEKSPQYPLDRRLDGPQSWFGHYGEEQITCSCRESNRGWSGP
jgi:hypothetical protein